MQRIWKTCMLLGVMLFLAGCGGKVELTESTLSITSKDEVKSTIVESFEESYYDVSELEDNIDREVKSYCLDVNREEAVAVESFAEEAGNVKLVMNYETVSDYVDFNDVLLFHGTYAEAKAAGYLPTELYDTKGETAMTDSEDLDELKVIITEESICIQTAKNIRYISDNVSIMDKRLAKAFEAGKNHPAFVLYK